MRTRFIVALVAFLVLALGGGVWAYAASKAKTSCCEPGSECCSAGLPSCDDCCGDCCDDCCEDCCDECCFPDSPCCQACDKAQFACCDGFCCPGSCCPAAKATSCCAQ
jgi:hypothetical protein